MTVPGEREDDPLVLDLFGFGTPARLDSGIGDEQPGALVPIEAPHAAPLSSSTELTRRQLREQERAVEVAAPAAARRSAASSPAAPRSKPRRTAKSTTRRDAVRVAAEKKPLGKRLLSFGAMLFAGALAFGLTVPANAFDTGEDEPLADTLAMEAQTAEVDPALAAASATSVQRDAWSVTSWAEMLRLRYGNRSFDYTVGTGPVRWPFPYAVPISSGFGDRAAPCRGCSTWHNGIDLTPGHGAAIFAIADGTVAATSSGGTTLGVWALIEHQIDGQTVFSGYAHMISGSTPLVVGQEVKVGDFVGLVGGTGQATGSHLHLTIAVGERESYVDPYTFLTHYTG